ncbi:phospholipid carrier-dependent glycosyltransferase [Phyllobacterium sp. SYP-B3895]|uniref:ArnT family glycosyltransferase n=1 Tax=Phyllobacterium sp. SYP-B3895 TaxID=2663240 RepID=UPI0012995F73|nr:phospholipid carrier-dependent glycosyltransferase [Phyllobacterium sp. SYP-B3895]MRG54753.1 phospholipid carrier-dependent glycosyltransferase [Phyllobacterium sp. SYP-B3895]
MPQDTMTVSAQPGPSSTATSRTKLAIFLALAFIIGLLPLGSSLILHFPDERYYSNGAVIMMQSGDYLTPHTAEGDVRLKKPPFTYWMSLAGMEIFGISVIGSRFFWLVGGAAILLATFQFTRILTRNDQTALLAAALLAANGAFLRASFNAIPDLPLTLFMLLGFIGFTGLLFKDDRQRTYALLAYGGTGFAVLTKGLLPLAMVAYVIAYAIGVASVRPRARRLWQPSVVLPSILIFGSWFAYQSFTASSELASDFVGDQLSEKVAIGLSTFVDGLSSNIAGLFLPVLLWLVMLLVGARTSGKRPTVQSIGAAAPFIAGWIVTVAIIFSLSRYASYRYIIPVIPLLCVLLAVALQSVMDQRADSVLRVILRISMILMAGALAVILLLGLLLLPPVIVVALAIIAVAGLAGLWLYSRGATTERLAACFALLLLGAAFISTPVLRGLLLPDIGAVIAAKAGPLHLPQDQVLFIGSHLDAAKLRLYMDREAPFPQMRRFPEAGIAPGIKLVMTNEQPVADELKLLGFNVEEVVGGWRRVEWPPFYAALRARDLIGARNQYGQRGWIATRP